MNTEFYDQALRGLTRVYRAHPDPTDLEETHLVPIQENPDGSVTIEIGSPTYGTLRWLRDNGFFEGSWIESNPLGDPQRIGCMGAQLTQRALRMMEIKEPNLGGRSIGEAAVKALESRPSDWPYVLEVFSWRLLEA